MSSSPATEPVLDGQVATDPRTGRPAGALQGGILLACACMAVLAAVPYAPLDLAGRIAEGVHR